MFGELKALGYKDKLQLVLLSRPMMANTILQNMAKKNLSKRFMTIFLESDELHIYVLERRYARYVSKRQPVSR